jgi:hypothetical protein
MNKVMSGTYLCLCLTTLKKYFVIELLRNGQKLFQSQLHFNCI